MTDVYVSELPGRRRRWLLTPRATFVRDAFVSVSEWGAVLRLLVESNRGDCATVQLTPADAEALGRELLAQAATVRAESGVSS